MLNGSRRFPINNLYLKDFVNDHESSLSYHRSNPSTSRSTTCNRRSQRIYFQPFPARAGVGAGENSGQFEHFDCGQLVHRRNRRGQVLGRYAHSCLEPESVSCARLTHNNVSTTRPFFQYSTLPTHHNCYAASMVVVLHTRPRLVASHRIVRCWFGEECNIRLSFGRNTLRICFPSLQQQGCVATWLTY